MNKELAILIFIVFIAACYPAKPISQYHPDQLPPAPDYQNPDSWAALPFKKDNADRTPGGLLTDRQDSSDVDVFFLHPTTYLGRKGEDLWNGPVDQEKLNRKTDESTILHQASIFNGAGRVFAPRYRQAHYHAYFTKDTLSAKKAFQQAYEDTKAAFKYYLEHYNQGRPIIIAGHSQGTTHAGTILEEFFDEKPLKDQLVAAYLVGMPVDEAQFATIKACKKADDIQCFCTWRSWRRGHLPTRFNDNPNVVVTNPLLWTTDTTYAGPELNKGTVLKNFNKGFKPGITDAQVHQNILWAKRPKFFGNIFLKTKNYHIADFNLFYVNVRENAQRRTEAFLNR